MVHREHDAGLGRLPDPDPCRPLGRAAAAIQGPARWRRGRSRTPRSRRPIREADEKNIPLFKKKLQFIKFSADELAAFRKAGGEPVWEEWVKLRESQGIPGRELLNFLLTQAGVAPKS